MFSQNAQTLIPGVCEYVTLHSKRDFARVLKVWDFKLGDYAKLARRAGYNHMSRGFALVGDRETQQKWEPERLKGKNSTCMCTS